MNVDIPFVMITFNFSLFSDLISLKKENREN
jgi:hypothetical protein